MLKEMRQALRELLQPRQADRAVEVAPEASPLRSGERGAAEQHRFGTTALARGDYSRARHALRQALELDPQSPALHYDLGLALRGEGEMHAALASFQQAVALQHDHVAAIFHAGKLHAELGDIDEAANCFKLALAFDPLSSAARIALAELLTAHRGVDSAIELLSEAVRDGNADTAVFCRLASLVAQCDDTAGAIAIFKQAIDKFPADPAPLVNLGLLMLGEIGNAQEAEALFRQASRLDAEHVEAEANLGLALHDQGRFEEALRYYEERLACKPDAIELRWNHGLANLMLGRYARGWDGYEMRKLRPDAGGIHAKYPFPDWDGSDLKGRAILVYGEQGLGDEIMFASCLPDVIARSGRCVIECDARLASLYGRSFPNARVEARGRTRERDWLATYPDLELQAASGSLPRYLRACAEDFPAGAGYLQADPHCVATWRQRLVAHGTLAKVGISWRGGTRKTRGGLRSLSLDQIAPLLEHGTITFVVLQRDVNPMEKAFLEKQRNVFLPELSGMDELAGLIAALELTITVPNTNLHLAGALGRPVWGLLSKSPEWRYLWLGERMPWYPSARLFRQPRTGDWHGVVQEVQGRLERVLVDDGGT